MEKKKTYRYLGKSLQVDHLLKGFVAGVFDQTKGTSFKWTENLGQQSHGQIAFIKKALREWFKIVNTKSGITITNYTIKGSFNELDRSPFKKYWEITIEFSVPGSLNTLHLHPSLAEKIAGFFKKFLAEELLRRFPMPSHRDVPFCAGIPYLYVLKPTRTIADELESMNAILLGDEFRKKLSHKLEESHGAELVFMKYLNTSNTKFWISTVLLVKWRTDATCDMRHRLEKDIRSVLLELGAEYKSGEFKHEYYNIHHDM